MDYELGSAFGRSGAVEGDPLDGVALRAKDITPLKEAIPEYLSVIQPRPRKVFLIDDLGLWPLFKVVAEFRFQGKQLYLVGRDRHTKQPFALGIPNGFIDMPFEACLRWTLNAHKGDKTIEV